MRRLSADLAHALAAEYVVGTLRGRARRRFEAIARADREVGAIVRRWEGFVVPLTARVAPVEPPARVWRAIEARIGRRGASSAPGFWSSLPFWRDFGLVAGGLAAALLVAFLWMGPGESEPLFVTVLASEDAVPRMVVSMARPGLLEVKVVKGWQIASDKDLELWVLPAEGAPRSLGVVRAQGEMRVRLESSDPRLANAKALAVSMEPRGGSRTGAPTGPVLCSGAIAATRRT